MTTPDDKVDPAVAQMRLRVQPKPVLRLSRKILIGAGALCGVALAAAMAYAITPKALPAPPPAAGETTPTHRPATTEALNNLPKDYTGVPKLGPPLPGDFGRPMLAAAQSNDAQSAAMPSDGSPSLTPAATGAPLDSQPEAQSRLAARTSQLFFPQPGTPSTDPTLPTPPSPTLPELAAWAAPPVVAPKSVRDSQRAFLV